MSTDITFCSNGFPSCEVWNKCARTERISFEKASHASYADFEPKKGKDCIGYKHKARLSLKPLEDK